ncbi:methyltransferase family protein [Streptomyces sp. NPDC056222]|uniref:methyltransferase family protein n=1 Tax=Streptomyces sp. NPDC056222 TaxID=3345749 RepID=UPI0035E26368
MATIVGITATPAAQSAMGASWRVGVDAAERTTLVTTGMFAGVRNPVFTAMTVTAIGLALMVPSVVAGLALAALVTAVQLQVRIVEEPYLRSRARSGVRRVHGPGRTFLARYRPPRRMTGEGRWRALEGCLGSIAVMLVRPAWRPLPALAALVAVALLACAHLMWGPGHSTMAMAAPMTGMTTTSLAVPTAQAATADAEQPPHQADPAHGECPPAGMDCPLATAQAPVPVALAADPGPDTLAAPPALAQPAARGADDGCAWPRAPDPVTLLCVSRT